MAWKKSPEELMGLLDESLKDVDCEKKKMFGFPAYFINKNMFTGTFEENLFIRLSKEDQDRITEDHEGVKPFEPMKGRVMKEYVVLPKSIYNNKKEFSLWMDRSIDYVSSLPIKKRKKK
jgi:TfoX/Sxy family transcriptional regulator of competence genes